MTAYDGPRTPLEIITRLAEVDEHVDFLGTERNDLVAALPYDAAVKGGWVQEGITEDQWNESLPGQPYDMVKEYLTFAIGKAQDHRGLSAMRSIAHLRAWCWLAGDDVYRQVIEEPEYAQYGVPHLKAAALWTGYPWPTEGPEVEELERMADGMPCRPDCMEGCG